MAVAVQLLLHSLSANTSSAYECKRSAAYDFVSIGWDSRTITYSVESGSDVDLSQVHAGLSAWTEQPCSDLSLIFVGERESAPDSGGFVDFVDSDWLLSDRPSDAVALTLSIYNLTSGRIRRSLIELNTDMHVFADVTEGCDPVGNSYDLIAVLTHEAGHFIGVDHSDVEGATMAAVVETCEAKKRTLAADDLDALCGMYPVGAPRGSCDDLPAVQIESEPFGCSNAGSSASRRRACSVVLLLLLAIARLGRQRHDSAPS